MFQKKIFVFFILLTIGLLTACGQQNDTESIVESDSTAKEAAITDEMKEKFGENCISEQTFEVELSEYAGKVYFVPFAPEKETQEFRMQIIQNDKVLARIDTYVPDELEGEKFTSLNEVGFWDVNYDGYTDIVLIETYGDTSFAAVYYGFFADAEDYDRNFFSQYDLSENISNKVEQLSISEIQKFLENGKKNGEFESFQEAYEAICRFCQLESSVERDYDLIYFNEDDIPELVSGHNGYYMSLYTYDNGTVYTLMNWWPYGAMGNAGYEYVPRKNSLRNYNSDAGALYTTYMTINEKHSLETVTFIETYIYEDENKNENSDGSENAYYEVSYIDGKEVSEEECESYNVGDYEDIEGKMSLEELKAKLKNQ